MAQEYYWSVNEYFREEILRKTLKLNKYFPFVNSTRELDFEGFT